MHDDDSQIHVPPSFTTLFVEPGRIRPRVPRQEIAARYELCEDLAQQLVELARALHHGSGIAQDEVLRRCAAGLGDAQSGLAYPESEWVIRRLAELLEWEWNCGDLFPPR